MITMPRGRALLRPVNPAFFAASLIAALALNLLPLGRLAWQPDWLLLALAFWALYHPGGTSLALAFLLGLCMDVAHAALLGQHALAYVLLVFICAAPPSRERLLRFSRPLQALHLVALWAALHLLQVALRFVAGDILPPATVLVAPLVEAILWPPVSALLLAPQSRPSRGE